MYNTLFQLVAIICILNTLTSCSEQISKPTNKITQSMHNNNLQIPIAQKIPHQLEIHGDKRIDPYYWLRDRDDQKVLDYLHSENAYTEQILKPTEALQEEIYQEIVGRIKKDDNTVPYKNNGYYYYTRYEKGKEYRIICRKKETLDADEEILLDENTLAKPYAYYRIGSSSVSPDNRIIVYGEDTLSRRIYTLRFKNIASGQYYPDVIENTTGGATWAADNKTIFYSRKDKALRSFKIFKHILGTDPKEDQEVYHEKDETFSTYVYKTKSKKYIIIGSWSTLSSEMRILEADDPDGQFRIFEPRKRDHEYSIEHFGDRFYITTNWDAKNFRLMETDLKHTERQYWKELIPHREDVLLNAIDVFDQYLVLSERKNGITQLRVIPKKGEEYYIQFPEKAYLAYTGINMDFDTDILRLGYQSMTTPNSTFDYNMATKKFTLLKEEQILGGFDKSNYKSERIMATARDGIRVPISIVYRKDMKRENQPLLLYGYGSYGNSMDPYFSFSRLSLLDRGFVFAIAHIRGGQEMGRWWYEDGKLLKKKNTFTDFIDCAEYLIYQKYTSKEQLYAMGGSAGGLLMGAIINMRPDLWKGIVAAVPFVDVVTTMLDESIPLTTGEYDEWGNPNDPRYYQYIKSYSPYDQLEAKKYPAMLVTTGLHDSQVQYWEPAKWVAKLRDLKTDTNPLILKIDMESGHGGASGRFKRHRDTALEYAFIIGLQNNIIK